MKQKEVIRRLRAKTTLMMARVESLKAKGNPETVDECKHLTSRIGAYKEVLELIKTPT